MPTVQNQKTEAAPKQKPVAEFQDGNLRLSIWRRIDKNGIARHSLSTTRSYQVDGKWQNTSSIGEHDAASGIRLLNRASEWLAMFHSASRGETPSLAA